MRPLTIVAASLNQTPLDWRGNVQRIKESLRSAQGLSGDIVCLPELCITGYGLEDLFLAPGIAVRAWEELGELLPHTKGLVVPIGLPMLHNGSLYNGSAFVSNGVLLGISLKQQLPNEGVHYEPRWFKPWPEGEVVEIDAFGTRVPVGDILYDINGVKFDLEICEDAWVADRVGRSRTAEGVDIVMNPSASHFAFGKQEVRRCIALEGARELDSIYVHSNLLGCEAGRIVFDGGALVAADGMIVAEASRFSFRDYTLCVATLPVGRSARNRDLDGKKPFVVRKEDPELFASNSNSPISAIDTRSIIRKEDEFLGAVTLGLFDYLRKSASNGFVLSLSGGADSAACAVLVCFMVKRAVRELGIVEVLRKLPACTRIKNALSEEEIVKNILTCVYQKTAQSSDITEKAAQKIAEVTGATFSSFSIEEIVSHYLKLGESVVGRAIRWESDDITLQNIQARVRSPSIWLVANALGALLLTTSNRSEASVGYATMDGDTSGGLAPLGGIDKAYLREWLRWVEKRGPTDLGSISSLKFVNDQEPTAELRPLETKQTDEGDLMPYVALDKIERAAIRDRKMPIETYYDVAAQFEGRYTKKEVKRWVVRFYRLWSRSQWKRERYAPAFHLDDHSVDPKSWCRFPILSGGFEEEIAKLEEAPE